MHPMACPEGYVELENGETNLTRLNFNKLTKTCEDIKVECHGDSYNTLWSTNAGNRLSPPWILVRLLIKTATALLYFFAL
ncbi:uncharacterized protein LOC131936028 isoform X2 [Physella acuta]|nr:uncharacterized protein LOC131936028 isoform X2 [Physella acuta]